MTGATAAFIAKYEAAIRAARDREAALEKREEEEGYSDRLGSLRIDETERQEREWSMLLAEAVETMRRG